MITKEQNRLKGIKYRNKHREKVREYDRKRYARYRGEEARVKRMEGKRCRLCTIFLSGKCGGFGTKFYCRSCYDSGQAKRHSLREATRRFRLNKLLEDNNK